MRRAGTRLRTIAARLFGARTMERLVDPTLADLQAEYEDAVGRGRKWEGRRVLMLGHLALVQVLTVHGGMRAMGILRDLTGEDRRALSRTVGASAAIMIVGTLVLAMVPFLTFVSPSQPDSAQLALYLVPQALPHSIPVGLTFGILFGLGRIAVSRRSRTVILLLGTMASVASFTMLGWVVPTANQAFRVSVFSHVTAQSGIVSGPLPKGANELTLGELRRLLEPGTRVQRPVMGPSDDRSLALNYHGRWAMAGTPLVLALFAVALSSRRRWGRVMPLLTGCLALVGYYVVMYTVRGLGRDLTLSAFTTAWTPNIAFVILSVAIIKLSSQQGNKAARA